MHKFKKIIFWGFYKVTIKIHYGQRIDYFYDIIYRAINFTLS